MCTEPNPNLTLTLRRLSPKRFVAQPYRTRLETALIYADEEAL